MTVLHLLKTVDGATWALRQVAVLRALGVEVVVVLPSARRGLASRYEAAGARVIGADLDFTPREPWRLAAAVRRCRGIVAEIHPDVIHSHFVSTTLVARVALGRRHPVPRLFQVPGPLHLEHPLVRRLDLASAGPGDRWIASCRWTREEYLRRGVAPERVFLSYYGTELSRLRSAQPGSFRRELGLARDVPLVGMVAWVYPPKRLLGHRRGVKGHEDFIAAVRVLLQTETALRAVVIGGPWIGGERYFERLQALGRSACGPALRFAGPRADVPAVYADLDVAVHPSLSENCGGAVESLAAGCPTVATAVGGLPDVVRDGDTGWLVPPRDPAALAAAIAAVLGDRAEARRRTLCGRALVDRLFDVRGTGAEIAAIYERVAGRVPAAAAEPARRRAAS